MKEIKEVLLSLLSVVASFTFVVLFIVAGWYIVWKVFLSRFKFVRELMGSGQPESEPMKPNKICRKRVRLE